MKGNKEVIRALNAALGQSLIAINQYFLHARIVKNWGIGELNEAFYKQSIQEMKWSDQLIERILLLEGLPNLQEYGKILIGESVTEILSCDLKLENRKHELLLDAIATCETNRDYVSRELLVALKDGNEEHIDWLDSQNELIESMGIQNYIQLKAQED